MFGFILFLLVIVAVVMLFSWKRKREVGLFRDASYADFVEYDSDKKDSSAATTTSIDEISASLIAASAKTLETRQSSTLADAESVAPVTGELSASPGMPANVIRFNNDQPPVYLKRSGVFDEVTRELLQNLYQIVKEDQVILTKLPAEQLARTASDEVGSVSHKAFLRNDHADFVVCNKTDLNAICVIQLPGIATERISEMCQQINLPLLKLKVGVNYSTLELHQALAPLLGLTKTVQECPHCEKSLAIKMARNGQRKGQYFWVCESCKYRRRVR